MVWVTPKTGKPADKLPAPAPQVYAETTAVPLLEALPPPVVLVKLQEGLVFNTKSFVVA